MRSTVGILAVHGAEDVNDEILPLGSALHASLIEQGMPIGGV